MYEWEDDDEDESPRWRKTVTRIFVLLAVVAAGWFVVRPRLVDSEGTNPLTFDAAGTAPATSEPPTSEPSTSELSTSATTSTTTGATSTSVGNANRTAGSTTTTVAPTTTAGSYPSLPDGSPEPVVVVLDDERVAVTGAVPSQQARDELLALVATSNQYPAAPFADELAIDPNVPVGVGVRLLDLNSALFPEASEEILPDHAGQLGRVVALMNAHPNVTAVIVGHADQRGSGEENLLLSRRHAEAIVAFLVANGIDASRLSARAVGEGDLLSVDDDEASLALNRRSELILYGLFVLPPQAPTSTSTTTTA